MPTYNPNDWPRLFEQHINAGNLEAVVELYEPQAQFVAPSGETVVGRDGIRQALASMIAARTDLHAHVVRVTTFADIAMLYTDFTGTTTNAQGDRVDVYYKAIELLRRQADGTWKLIVGDPHARG